METRGWVRRGGGGGGMVYELLPGLCDRIQAHPHPLHLPHW